MIRLPSHFLRVYAIQRALVRHGFDEILFTIPMLQPVRFLRHLMPRTGSR